MNKNLLYIIILLVFIPIGTAKNIIVHDNIIVNSSAVGGGNVTNNYYTSSVLALTCNPANEASYYNGTGFQCVSISDSDPYILLTSESNLNVNSATYWAGLINPSPDWNSNKSIPWQNLTGAPTDYPNTTLNNYGGSFPNSTLPNYLLISTYGSNFPNNTLSSYGGNFPNSTLPNYLLSATYGTNFPNNSLGNYYLNSNPFNFYNSSTVPAYLLISTYGTDYPNASYIANDSTTLTTAKSYVDTVNTTQNNYIDAQDTFKNTSMNNYVNAMNTSQNNYVNANDSATLTTAKAYTDTKTSSDPWTYITLPANFTTSIAIPINVNASGVWLNFTPAANKNYTFEAMLTISTATTTVNPRVGLNWSTGSIKGTATIRESQTATTGELFAFGSYPTNLLIAAGGLPTNNIPMPATVTGMFTSGATPTGNISIQMASETAATVVTVWAGSFLRYRTY